MIEWTYIDYCVDEIGMGIDRREGPVVVIGSAVPEIMSDDGSVDPVEPSDVGELS